MIIWAKLSDLLGRKPSFLISVFIFLSFSGACGGAQTMDQLYFPFPTPQKKPWLS